MVVVNKSMMKLKMKISRRKFFLKTKIMVQKITYKRRKNKADYQR